MWSWFTANWWTVLLFVGVAWLVITLLGGQTTT